VAGRGWPGELWLGVAGALLVCCLINKGVVFMKRFRLFGLVVVALVALTAAVTSTGASALTLPALLPIATGGVAFTDESDSANPTLNTKEHVVTCESAQSTGFQETDTLGTFHITFLKCKTEILGACTSSGDASGQILTLGSFHYVLDTLATSETSVAVLFLTAPTTFSCTNLANIVTKGTLVCLILTPLVESKTHLFHCTQSSAGVQAGNHYYNDNGTLVETHLEATFNGGAEESASEVALAAVFFAKAVAFEND
jgi:hypothetical protein